MAQVKAEKEQFSRNVLVSSLLRIDHNPKDGARRTIGDRLMHYSTEGFRAAKADPELLGHFVAWNHINGKVRDARVALPIIALRHLSKADQDLAENAIAHLVSLNPRELVRAYDFNKALVKAGHKISGGWRSLLERAMKRYLEVREAVQPWWDRTALQHRENLKRLYRITHKHPTDRARSVLFEGQYPTGSIFEAIRHLRTLSPNEAAGVILTKKIPFEVAIGSVAQARNKEITLALIEGMTGNQLITNSAMLERLGVGSDPALKGAFEAALDRARKSTKVETLKAGRAAKETKGEISEKLGALQETKLKQLGGIDGDWLVLGDRSGSMAHAIEMARQVAGLIAKQVTGKVHLVFFDSTPTYFDVTGKTYEEILNETRRIHPGGQTSMGCGLEYIRSKDLVVQGIAVVTDGGENCPPGFVETYQKYQTQFGVEPTVYEFLVPSHSTAFSDRCRAGGLAVETFKLGAADYYALPNLITTLRVNRFAIFDEIMATPFLTLDKVFAEMA